MNAIVLYIKMALVWILKLPFILIGKIIREAFHNIFMGTTGVLGTVSYLVLAAMASAFFYTWMFLGMYPAIIIFCMLSWMIWDYEGAHAALV